MRGIAVLGGDIVWLVSINYVVFCAVTGKLLGKLRAAGHDNAFQVLGVEFHQLFIILVLLAPTGALIETVVYFIYIDLAFFWECRGGCGNNVMSSLVFTDARILKTPLITNLPPHHFC